MDVWLWNGVVVKIKTLDPRRKRCGFEYRFEHQPLSFFFFFFKCLFLPVGVGRRWEDVSFVIHNFSDTWHWTNNKKYLEQWYGSVFRFDKWYFRGNTRERIVKKTHYNSAKLKQPKAKRDSSHGSRHGIWNRCEQAWKRSRTNGIRRMSWQKFVEIPQPCCSS